jgi:3-oxoacyl-[acyl-carrier protein] reductase
MIECGKGAIVIMSSSAGRVPGQVNIAYACAEAGATMLTKHLANEVAKHNVRVNCIAPSAIRNERMEKFMSEEQMAQMTKMFPLGRIGKPEDIAQATAFLVSDASA